MQNSPLDNYSSLQEVSFLKLFGINKSFPFARFFVQYSFNLHTPLEFHPQAHFIMHTLDARLPPMGPNCCFSIHNFTRWNFDISPYRSFDDYLSNTIRWHRCNYAKAKKNFLNYGCEVSFIEGDWTEHTETVNRLYNNVAKRYGHRLYNLKFFQEAAKRPDYKLLCAWFEGEMIGVFVLQEEMPTLHSICCGFDYKHSTASYAYSWMHQVLLDQAISIQKYQSVDVGFSADDAKRTIGFKPLPSRMDIYSIGKLSSGLLKATSRFLTASITPKQNIKLHWR